MESNKKIHDEIQNAVMEHRAAVARNAGISVARDRVKNILFSHRDEILESLAGSVASETALLDALKREEILKKEAELLNEELETVDSENNELRKRLRELEESKSKKGKPKTMTAVVE